MAFDYAAKVRMLLALAESERKLGHDEAAANAEAKAFRFMADYAIAEEDALAVDPTIAVPTSLTVEFGTNDYAVSMYYPMMAQSIAKHTGCRVYTARLNSGKFRVTVVGYEGDVRYFEFLWTSAHLMFATRIDPTWDAESPEADNIFRMRRAGIERRVIADKAWGSGAGALASNRSKVQRIYLRQAEIAGEAANATGLGFNTKHYREAYAESFVTTLTRRMRQARDAADSVGALPTLHGRADRVDEAFYEMFPRMRPSTTVAEAYVPANETCDKCLAAKSGYCRNHQYLKPRTWSQADEARYLARTNGSSARAGSSSGRTAAEGVVLRGTAARTDRVDGSGKAIEG